jgi:hypothetical protein
MHTNITLERVYIYICIIIRMHTLVRRVYYAYESRMHNINILASTSHAKSTSSYAYIMNGCILLARVRALN